MFENRIKEWLAPLAPGAGHVNSMNRSSCPAGECFALLNWGRIVGDPQIQNTILDACSLLLLCRRFDMAERAVVAFS
jgi:hypothetical protein